MSFSNNPFSDYPWVEYDHKQGKFVVSPQKLSMFLTGPKCPHSLKAVEQVGQAKPIIYIYYEGYYKQTSWNELNWFIKQLMPPELRTSRNVEDVIYELKTEQSVSMDEFDSDENIVNFNNGIYHFDTNELTPHSPEILSSIRIPCNYNGSLTLERDAPVFYNFLGSLTSGDCVDQAFLLEFIGAIVSNVPGYRFKKCLILVGPGNTGKSVLRQLVISIIGPDNCQTLDICKLNDRFSTSQLYGKRLAGSGDMSTMRVQEMSTLKNLSGGDDVNAEFKGKDAFSYRFNGLLWFCCNDLPAFGGDRGRHVYERFNIVLCNNVITPDKRDSRLLQKLLAEKDAIVSVALRYFAEAVKRGYKFSESETMSLTRDEYADRNNSLVIFVKEGCSMEGKTKRSEFRRVYHEWCKLEGMYPEQTRNIDAVLKENFGIVPVKSGEYYYNLTIKDHVMLSLPRK